MTTCKYGDERKVLADVKVLNDIIARQGVELLLDCVAEHLGGVVNKFNLDARERKKLVADTCQTLHEALLERT